MELSALKSETALLKFFLALWALSWILQLTNHVSYIGLVSFVLLFTVPAKDRSAAFQTAGKFPRIWIARSFVFSFCIFFATIASMVFLAQARLDPYYFPVSWYDMTIGPIADANLIFGNGKQNLLLFLGNFLLSCLDNVTAAAVVITSPLAAIALRGFAQSKLRERFGPRTSIILMVAFYVLMLFPSALIKGIQAREFRVLVSVAAIIHLVGIGLISGYFFERSKSIWPVTIFSVISYLLDPVFHYFNYPAPLQYVLIWPSMPIFIGIFLLNRIDERLLTASNSIN